MTSDTVLGRPKKFRYSLRALLALPVLFAAPWWWWTWPQRTFEAFTSALVSQRSADAKAMVVTEERSFECDASGIVLRSANGKLRSFTRDADRFVDTLRRNDRTLADVLLARSVYRPYPLGSWSGWYEFVVERGRVTLRRARLDTADIEDAYRSRSLSRSRARLYVE